MRQRLDRNLHPIGKLLTQRCSEEVAEYNGQNGAPLWVSIGMDIYDITGAYFHNRSPTSDELIRTTDFEFSDDEERRILTSNPGSGISMVGFNTITDKKGLMNRLAPYKRALFGHKRPDTMEPGSLTFTPTMLAWYDNPCSGIYTAVDGIVYDITCKY